MRRTSAVEAPFGGAGQARPDSSASAATVPKELLTPVENTLRDCRTPLFVAWPIPTRNAKHGCPPVRGRDAGGEWQKRMHTHGPKEQGNT